MIAYLAAVVIAILGVYGRYLLNPLLGRDAPLLLSVIAVTVAARYGGLGPGLLATVVSAAGGITLFMRHSGSMEILTLGQVVRLLAFLLTGAIVSSLTGELHRTTREWRRAEETAEQASETAVLQERNRLAREIHDTLAQGFTGIVIQLEAAEDMLADAPQEAQAHLDRARMLARESLAEARRSVQALRPRLLEQRDLAFALRYYVDQMTAGTSVRGEFEMLGTPPPYGLPHEVESHLLRIGLEALTNALKHARARNVRVTLDFAATSMRLSVRDDGCGFTTDSASVAFDRGHSIGFGLAAMQERAERIGARLSVASQPGQGSDVTVTVDLNVALRTEGAIS